MSAWTDYKDDADFAAKHEPGSLVLTASRWVSLVIPPAQRPGWMPSPYRLALHMLGKQPLPDDRPELDWGTRLEPVAAGILRERHPEFTESWGYWTHPSLPALASPDLVSWEKDRGSTAVRSAEIKIVFHTDVRHKWADGPPLPPRIQAQCQMACGGHDEVMIFGCVIGHKELPAPLIFTERRNPTFITRLEHAAEVFLDNLTKGRLPKPEEIRDDYAALQRMAPKQIKGKLAAVPGEEAVVRMRKWRQAKLDARAASTEEDAQKFWFTLRVPNDAEIIMLDDGTAATRKLQARKGFTVEPSESWVFNVNPAKLSSSEDSE